MRISQPNITIEDRDEFPIAAVEITNMPDIQLDQAIEIRSHMLERGLPSHIPYFLLLSPDSGFLWKGGRLSDMDSPPDLQFPMDTVMAQYSKKPPEQRLYTGQLEYLFARWLIDLKTQPQAMVEELEKKLMHVGFTDAIHHAAILITGDRETL